jgi:hypothetical protein
LTPLASHGKALELERALAEVEPALAVPKLNSGTSRLIKFRYLQPDLASTRHAWASSGPNSASAHAVAGHQKAVKIVDPLINDDPDVAQLHGALVWVLRCLGSRRNPMAELGAAERVILDWVGVDPDGIRCCAAAAQNRTATVLVVIVSGLVDLLPIAGLIAANTNPLFVMVFSAVGSAANTQSVGSMVTCSWAMLGPFALRYAITNNGEREVQRLVTESNPMLRGGPRTSRSVPGR